MKFSLKAVLKGCLAVFLSGTAFFVLFSGKVSACLDENGGGIFYESIFPPQAEHAHGSSLAELPNGDLLAVWFQGSGERTANDVRLMGARKKPNAPSWSEPFLMADTPNIPDCNPVLFLNSGGKLFLVWIAVLSDRWEESILRVRTSADYTSDGPPVWEWQDNIFFKPDEAFADEVCGKIRSCLRIEGLSDEEYEAEMARIESESRDLRVRSIGWMTRIKPLILPSGRILLPLYSDGFNFSLIAVSDDDGATWCPSLPIVGLGIQPALALSTDGGITAYMRNASGDVERIWTSRSTDNGESWTLAERTERKSTASVELLRLADGRWIYIANDTDSGRWRLSLYVSSDEGKNWTLGAVLEQDRNRENHYCYPCVIQTRDGMIHVTYSFSGESSSVCGAQKGETIKHIRLNPDYLPGR